MVYGRTNQIDAAVNELENVLRLNPKDAQALELLRELKQIKSNRQHRVRDPK
jgi:hypothetical protein